MKGILDSLSLLYTNVTARKRVLTTHLRRHTRDALTCTMQKEKWISRDGSAVVAIFNIISKNLFGLRGILDSLSFFYTNVTARKRKRKAATTHQF